MRVRLRRRAADLVGVADVARLVIEHEDEHARCGHQAVDGVVPRVRGEPVVGGGDARDELQVLCLVRVRVRVRVRARVGVRVRVRVRRARYPASAVPGGMSRSRSEADLRKGKFLPQCIEKVKTSGTAAKIEAVPG